MNKILISYLKIMFIFYIASSYVNLEINPFAWSEGIRFLFAFCGSVVSLIISLILNDFKLK